MSKFNTSNYKRQLLSNPVGWRLVDRGFLEIQSAFVEHAVNLITNDSLSLAELGIGSGNTLVNWSDNLPSAKIYGVDIFCPHSSNIDNVHSDYRFFYEDLAHYNQKIISYGESLENVSVYENIKLIYACDGYDKSSATKVIKENGGTIDIVIDDASPSGQSLHLLKSAWQDAVSPNGCIISQTLTGNGTLDVYNQGLQYHIDLMRDKASPQGYICFDTSDFVPTETRIDYILPLWCFWSPNMELYAPIIDKWKRYIVAGEKNY